MKNYEKLDKEIYDICRKVEDRCRAAICGPYQWSPKLSAAIHQLSYWRARLKHPTENNLIQHLGEKAGEQFEFRSIAEIHDKINQCRAALRDIQQDSVKHRQQHLADVAEVYATENNLSKATAVRELISHESTRRMYAILKEKLKERTTGQLGKVWVAYTDEGDYVKDQNSKIEFTKVKEIHKHLLHRNRKHLSQARNTPFASGKWAIDLKWDGTGDIGSEILSGNILNKQRFDQTVQLYFESLKTTQMNRSLNTTKPFLSLTEYKRFWKKSVKKLPLPRLDCMWGILRRRYKVRKY